jgi:nitrogen regulatory protein PII
VEIICPDDQVAHIVSTIARHAHTGNPGDGIISVSTLTGVVRIRTEEEYRDAR